MSTWHLLLKIAYSIVWSEIQTRRTNAWSAFLLGFLCWQCGPYMYIFIFIYIYMCCCVQFMWKQIIFYTELRIHRATAEVNTSSTMMTKPKCVALILKRPMSQATRVPARSASKCPLRSWSVTTIRPFFMHEEEQCRRTSSETRHVETMSHCLCRSVPSGRGGWRRCAHSEELRVLPVAARSALTSRHIGRSFQGASKVFVIIKCNQFYRNLWSTI